MAKQKWFKWVVEFQVDTTWVADGFEMTDERAADMLANDLQSAYTHELRAKVIKRPALSKILAVQGYNREEQKILRAHRRIKK
jgi:hypothetical protein